MSITLRNKTTDQANDFDTQEAADNFLAAIDSPADWIDPHAAPVAEPTVEPTVEPVIEQAAPAAD